MMYCLSVIFKDFGNSVWRERTTNVGIHRFCDVTEGTLIVDLMSFCDVVFDDC